MLGNIYSVRKWQFKMDIVLKCELSVPEASSSVFCSDVFSAYLLLILLIIFVFF